MAYTYTTVEQLRAAFWRDHADIETVSKRKIRNHAGNGKMYNTDTRCAFCDWLDAANKNREVSDSLANRATL